MFWPREIWHQYAGELADFKEPKNRCPPPSRMLNYRVFDHEPFRYMGGPSWSCRLRSWLQALHGLRNEFLAVVSAGGTPCNSMVWRCNYCGEHVIAGERTCCSS